MAWCPWQSHRRAAAPCERAERIINQTGHALRNILVVPALTLAVDPLLKKRLIKDVSKDIFQHLLGIDFPPEIRDAFQKALPIRKQLRALAEQKMSDLNAISIEAAENTLSGTARSMGIKIAD